MLKILQARLQQYMNHELSDVQARLEKAEQPEIKFKLILQKAEEPEIKLPTSAGLWKKQESSRKKYLLLLS